MDQKSDRILRTKCRDKTGTKVLSLSQGLEWEGSERKMRNLGGWGGYFKMSTTSVCQ